MRFFAADEYQKDFNSEAVEAILRSEPSDCTSDFDAASKAITSRTQNAYHETGVFGSACRHDIPLEFTNIFISGEKFMYPLAVVKALTEKYGYRINIMYDIACRFRKLLETTFLEIKDNGCNMAIGIFHAYAHTMKCQVKYNPRYVEGYSLTDGESMERIWS
ncbi:hypothetical protein BJV82DRAFT_522983 [Fennellomyces sp. T-0311]|nr:hypothetical protein BJV82DRAFT_522983 [Fennellomyces sp. T-0311]